MQGRRRQRDLGRRNVRTRLIWTRFIGCLWPVADARRRLLTVVAIRIICVGVPMQLLYGIQS